MIKISYGFQVVRDVTLVWDQAANNKKQETQTGLKGMIQAKILVSFIHPHVVPNWMTFSYLEHKIKYFEQCEEKTKHSKAVKFQKG